MIVNGRVLREGFVPNDVRHRDGEVDHLASSLKPVTEEKSAPPIIITGPTGAGKTCIARYVGNKLEETTLNVDVIYINCWQNYSRFRCLYSVLEYLGHTVDIHRQSTPHDELLDRIKEHRQHPVVLILDEVDQLEDMSILYDLYNITNISLVLVANREEDLFSNVENRISSRLTGSHRIAFDAYTHTELTGILKDRIQWGLQPGVIEEDIVDMIADAAAGDARIAISILRVAARQAASNDADRISKDTVAEAIPEGKQAVLREGVESLRPEQRLLYDIIEDAGRISPSDLYERYNTTADEERTERTLRNYLQKLERYNLIVAEGRGPSRNYRVPTPNDEVNTTPTT